jgi:lipopolysaccharide export system protein LptC
MGLLAMLTYWLVKNTPLQANPAQNAVPSHTIDYYLKNFSVKSYQADGQLHSIIYGQKANHFADTLVLEITSPKLKTFDVEHNMTRASANQAFTNADGSELQLMGQAVVVRGLNQQGTHSGEELEMRSEFLDFLIDEDKLFTHEPVELKKGKSTFQALDLVYDNSKLILNLKGKVHAQLAPKAN